MTINTTMKGIALCLFPMALIGCTNTPSATQSTSTQALEVTTHESSVRTYSCHNVDPSGCTVVIYKSDCEDGGTDQACNIEIIEQFVLAANESQDSTAHMTGAHACVEFAEGGCEHVLNRG